MFDRTIHWFRRDLRLSDNRALYEACLHSKQVISVFVFDINILNNLNYNDDKRVNFIFETLMELKKDLLILGSDIFILYGDPIIEIPKISKELNVECVFSNKDYESYAKNRDKKIEENLRNQNIKFLQFKDQVVFEEKEILNMSGEPYKVFTPYKNSWLKKCKKEDIFDFSPNLKNLFDKNNFNKRHDFSEIESIGFKKSSLILRSGRIGAVEKLNSFLPKLDFYDKNRNTISFDGTSQISIYLRFGVVSVRELFRYANNSNSIGAQVWKNELIWREFYQMILSQFSYVEVSAFKREYVSLKWKGKEENFEKWCYGQTGFPIIDSAMRCFNQTGWMHNRLRMIVASFLTKDLLINYKKGEEYFAQKLMDYDLASNNGGWQWCASTGCDAQPYFRVFNPETQSKNFDSQGIFIKKYCPELSFFSEKHIHAPHKADINEQNKARCKIGLNYPFPIVNHDQQRLKAIEMFNKK